MSLKDEWKTTGSDLGHAFKALGKALIKTASTAAKKADEWASGDDDNVVDADIVEEAKSEDDK